MRIYAKNTLIAAKDNHVIAGLLLPFGEKGYTNKGTVTASRGVLKPVKGKPVFLDVEHDHKARIGHAISLQEKNSGLYASFRIAETDLGRNALAEIEAGLRNCLSIEIDEPIIKAGKIIGGQITAAALVAEPAFPSAALTASVPDTQEQVPQETSSAEEVVEESVEDIEQITELLENVEENLEKTTTSEETTKGEDKEMSDNNELTAAKPVTFGTMQTKQSEETHNKQWLLANLTGQTRDSRLTAALSDVVPANILGIEQPQYVGELWNGRAYERKIIPLFNHADLTSWEVSGWQWKTKPTVNTYEGNKTEIPSAKIETEALKIAAKRIAGGHDIDRKFRDFADQEFWNAYFAAMTESYARVSDALVLTEIKAAATQVKSGAKPENIAQGIVNIVDGALSIMNETDTVPTGAIVASDLWRDIMLTPQEHVLGYLSAAMSLENGTLGAFPIIPSAALAAGETLVVTKPAVTVHELAGSPIRVEAIDINKGGIDEAVFGYYAVNVHDKGGLALVNKAEDSEEA